MPNLTSCVVTGPDPKPHIRGENRTFRVWLDPNQYQQDMTKAVQGEEVIMSCYLSSTIHNYKLQMYNSLDYVNLFQPRTCTKPLISS